MQTTWSLLWLALVACEAAKLRTPSCRLDPGLWNEGTIGDVSGEIGVAVLAGLCGRNRGTFVLDPPDDQTYGCLNLPATEGAWGGKKVVDANAIQIQYEGSNITAESAVSVLNAFISSVYISSDNPASDLGA
jgi:hypothetical protein